MEKKRDYKFEKKQEEVSGVQKWKREKITLYYNVKK